MTKLAVIEKVQKKGRHYLVRLLHGSEFLISAKYLDQYGLTSGMKIEPDLLDDIKHRSDLQRAEDYLVYLLSRRAYSSGHLMAKMFEKGYDKETITQIIDKFEEKGLIDDVVFAREFAESILRNKPAGRSYVIGCLKQKHISHELAKSIVDELFAGVDEFELALRLLRGRWSYFSKFELETARRKAYNYLSRRSIDYRAAKQAFEKMLSEDE
ncbi:MAG: hypothetical protein DRP46_03230 [Candidatus Zixiibacteriota bacterium]|nr:MAG: hypothetical protein DRP46_03230 [candidate division Zixibacteria bacterium]